jgi:hypothetical protein
MNDKTVATIPQRNEVAVSHSFDQIRQMANSFAKSGLFGVKDPDQALSLLLYGQALGKHPAIIMRDYNLINNRLAKTAEAMLRDFQASGGRVDWKKYDDEGCVGVFTHPLSPTPITIDWDMNRAKKAGLAGKNGDMYGKYTRAMFRSRVISEGVRTTAPDATENMYTPEEIRTIAAEEVPEPVSITQAVNDAAAQITNAIPEDELDAMVSSLDVKTMAELTPAFGRAYKRAKTAGDEHAMKKLKSNYDSMKEAIESGSI